MSTAKRTQLAPELPTVGEAIPGFEADSWTGLMVPAGTPPEIVARIQSEMAKIVASDDMKQRFATMGADAVASTPADFKAFLDAETLRYARLVKEANLKLE